MTSFGPGGPAPTELTIQQSLVDRLLGRRVVWLSSGSVRLEGFSAKAAIRWHCKRNWKVEP